MLGGFGKYQCWNDLGVLPTCCVNIAEKAAGVLYPSVVAACATVIPSDSRRIA